MPDEVDPARRAAEEIAEDVFKKLGKGKNDCPPDCGKCAFQKECKEQENILIDYLAAIIARCMGETLAKKDKRISELERAAINFFRAAVASNRNYPGDLNLLVELARRERLCADTVEIHVNGGDVQIVGLKKEAAPCREK